MDFDPFIISSLKSKIADNETLIGNLQAEMKRKNEERKRMETQIIQLSQDIASKDEIVDDLEKKIKSLEKSVEDLSSEVKEKEGSSNLTSFLKDELEKREKEVVMLTRERDMINWKLIDEASSDTGLERNKLREANKKLTNKNNDFRGQINNLSNIIDILTRRNLDLTSELEKRTRQADKLKSDFDAAVQSREKIRVEMLSAKRRLANSQTSMKSLTPSTELKSYSVIRSATQSKNPQAPQPPSLSSAGTKGNNPILKKSGIPRNQVDIKIQKAMPNFREIETNTVRKLVRNIQSSLMCSPVTPPNAEHYLLPREKPEKDIENKDKRKNTIQNIRGMLESNVFQREGD